MTSDTSIASNILCSFCGAKLIICSTKQPLVRLTSRLFTISWEWTQSSIRRRLRISFQFSNKVSKTRPSSFLFDFLSTSHRLVVVTVVAVDVVVSVVDVVYFIDKL